MSIRRLRMEVIEHLEYLFEDLTYSFGNEEDDRIVDDVIAAMRLAIRKLEERNKQCQEPQEEPRVMTNAERGLCAALLESSFTGFTTNNGENQ